MKKTYSTKHITVHSVREAWNKANELMPTDYEYDTDRTRRAGYPIYFSTCDSVIAWVSDLGNRLEVNLPNGDSVEVWIEEEQEVEATETETETEPKPLTVEEAKQMVEATKAVERMTVNALYAPDVCQLVTVCITGGEPWVKEDEQRVYDAIKGGHPTIGFDILTRYAETHGIKWGGISRVKFDHYDHGKRGGGHYIVSGLISSRVGYEMSFSASCAQVLNERSEENILRREARG